ncbi:hypothetical protein COLO4_32025 [Corchorus olitorius]|uniref:Large ribosomal subunit protein mL53 n=1 Tax=Corchorus olitorius TaxID=93759 RepID=A0A1R3H2L9_9ROSI|nr:hypothetical protein COLO4_32025 [Corchorus olitorius]
MLKFLSKVRIEFNALDPRLASAMEFLAQCNARKAKESNPACQVQVKRRTDDHPPQITVTFVNGVEETFDATATPAQTIRNMILEKGKLLETEQMFREAGEKWPVIIPEEELHQSFPGTKVQNNHLESFFKPQLEKLGYSVYYKSKNRKVELEINKYVSEGCAIFYRTDRFEMVKKDEIDFEKEAELEVNKMENEDKTELRRTLVKDNHALFLVLEDSKTHSQICVANTHLAGFEEGKLARIYQHISEGATLNSAFNDCIEAMHSPRSMLQNMEDREDLPCSKSDDVSSESMSVMVTSATTWEERFADMERKMDRPRKKPWKIKRSRNCCAQEPTRSP